MPPSPLPLPLRSLLLLTFALGACDVGSVLPEGGVDGSGPGVDGATGGDGGADGPSVTCEPAATNLPNGEHRPGEACLGCHNGNGAPRFTVAGTVYASAQGGAAVPGATIVVTDAGGVVTRLVTASNGNFYSNRTFAFPVQVSASKCPDTRPMIGAVASTGGDCNTCHQTATSGRIYLP